MDVLLDDHVAAAGVGGVLVADQDGFACGLALRILGAVDEPEHVAFVEGPESVYLVDDVDEPAQPLGQPLGELEAQVEPVGADVKQQVAGRRDSSVACPVELAEGMQVSGAGTASQPIPQRGADPDHQRELGFGHAESHRALESRGVRQGGADLGLGARTDRQHRKIAASVGMLRID